MKVNGKEIKWEDAPKGYFPVSGVKQHVLWQDEKTGASLTLIMAPKGMLLRDQSHSHPDANQWEVGLSGEVELANGTHISDSGGNITFSFTPRGKTQSGVEMKVIRDAVSLRYQDGPSTRVDK